MGVKTLDRHLEQFLLDPSRYLITEVNKGHINDTFHLEAQHPEGKDFILQRINHHVFEDVPAVMHNFELVGKHLETKKTDQVTLKCFPTKDGLFYYRDEQGNYWRLINYIKHASSLDSISNTFQAFQVGKAYGYFNYALSDLPANKLKITIPDFHNVEKRIELLNEVYQGLDSAKKRKREFSLLFEFVHKRAEELTLLDKLLKEGKLPQRITHNDTKYNNVLLDLEGKAIAVVDLDTVMPGLVHYDFGDAIRTLANTACEDDPNIDKITFSIPFYKAFSQAFLKETAAILTTQEINTLGLAVKIFPFLMGIRFFTDYLQGNIYYKINHPLQNLHRAKNQFALLENIEKKYQDITDILEEILHNNSK